MHTLVTLDPGHFHAALLQKTMSDQVSPLVYVYAPEGDDLEAHLHHIHQFNTRTENPTAWHPQVYRGPDFLETMLAQQPGNVVVIAGINASKTTYISAATEAGLHVLADKPMCIDIQGWEVLKTSFASAAEHGVLLRDIMTSRHEITNILYKELLNDAAVFGTLERGSPEKPTVVKQSVHHLYKQVAGRPLIRPGWYFDVTQQGKGIVDVTTHLVDLVMWECFPEQMIDYVTDIDVLCARHWTTLMTRAQFMRVTGLSDFPLPLHQELDDNGNLPYACNGEMLYTVKGIHTKIIVEWRYQAPPGGGDTHTSETRGTLCTVRIHQGEAQGYRPELYVEAAHGTSVTALGTATQNLIARMQIQYPGVGCQREGDTWHVTIPDVYRVGHEAHFAEVFKTYLNDLDEGDRDWEVPNMLAKYYTTTKALAIAQQSPLSDQDEVLALRSHPSPRPLSSRGEGATRTE